jgi:hypothetical protein
MDTESPSLRTLYIVRNSKYLENTGCLKLDLYQLSGEGRQISTLLGPLGNGRYND